MSDYVAVTSQSIKHVDIEKLRNNDPSITKIDQLKEDFERYRKEVYFPPKQQVKTTCEALLRNTHVTELHIGVDCDENLQLLTSLLAHNTNIKDLYLGIAMELVTTASLEAFWKVIASTTTLQGLFLNSYQNNSFSEMKNALKKNFSIVRGYCYVSFLLFLFLLKFICVVIYLIFSKN